MTTLRVAITTTTTTLINIPLLVRIGRVVIRKGARSIDGKVVDANDDVKIGGGAQRVRDRHNHVEGLSRGDGNVRAEKSQKNMAATIRGGRETSETFK